MQKVLDAGAPLNIDIPGDGVVQPLDVKGKVTSVRWWMPDHIFSAQYTFVSKDGQQRTLNYMVRMLSGKMFDDMYTLKKVDGVLTLLKKQNPASVEEEKEPDGDRLLMDGKLALSIIQKWLERGDKVLMVNARGITTADGQLIKVEQLTRQTVDGISTNWHFFMQAEDGWTSNAYFTAKHINALTLKVVPHDGVKILLVSSKSNKYETN